MRDDECCAICNLLLTTASICEPFPQLASSPLRSQPKYCSLHPPFWFLFNPFHICTPLHAPRFLTAETVDTICGFPRRLIPNLNFSAHCVFEAGPFECHVHANQPTKVSWRTGSPLLMRPSSRTGASLRVNTRASRVSPAETRPRSPVAESNLGQLGGGLCFIPLLPD